MRTQFGHSMIEMLGVLAIIGVLSIGGIALYRRAVNNHHANTILDDVNRFAFAIIEKGGFPANAFIDNVQYERTSTYNLDAFVGAAGGQFGIVVTDVPKGVCEPLVDKAVIEYKVRVLPANTAESVAQISSTGLVYDAFHKDICINDMNDVILYFGDTSAQCNVPEEGQDGNPCNSNAECCGEYFCAFENPVNSKDKGDGECQEIKDSDFQIKTITVDDVQSTWIRSKGKMTWWSADAFCQAFGKRMAQLEDINYKADESPHSNIMATLRDAGEYKWYWLNSVVPCRAPYLTTDSFGSWDCYGPAYKDKMNALCR